jgi:predicted nucleic acid-binding Zn ribbon protein
MERICKKCGVEKDITLFRNSYKSDSGYYHTCLDCYNNIRRENYDKKYRLKKAVQPSEKKCVVCGVLFTSKQKRKKVCSNNCARKFWIKNNPERNKEIAQKWYSSNKQKYNIIRNNTRSKNILRYKKIEKNNNDKARLMLLDGYVKQRLVSVGVNNPTNEMIEQKRLQLMIKRKIKQLKQLSK